MMHSATRMCMLLLLISVALAIHVPASSRSWLTEVHSPHMCDAGASQTTGYFNIDPSSSKKYFYWYFESQSNPKSDPVILWLTGGPGCSGEIAIFAENGPCIITANGMTRNPYSWNSRANIIYVDQPAGTGFSTADQSGWDTNEAGVAKDLDAFLRHFFMAHKDIQSNPFYIFGESYGGHYAPATAHYIWNQNKAAVIPKINLVGVGIGNGLTNPGVQYQYYPEMIYNFTSVKLGHPIVSEAVYAQMMQDLPGCIETIKKCNQGSSEDCMMGMYQCQQALMQPYSETGLNVYDIRIPCEHPPLCYDFSPITQYLNDKDVQRRIGVDQEWQECNMDVNRGFLSDFLLGFEQQIPELLEGGIEFMIYAGDCDYICNWLGNMAWTRALEWSGQDAFNQAPDLPLHIPGEETSFGLKRSASGLSFIRIYNAGHMVPRDQPKSAVYIVQGFTKVQPSPSSLPQPDDTSKST